MKEYKEVSAVEREMWRVKGFWRCNGDDCVWNAVQEE